MVPLRTCFLSLRGQAVCFPLVESLTDNLVILPLLFVGEGTVFKSLARHRVYCETSRSRKQNGSQVFSPGRAQLFQMFLVSGGEDLGQGGGFSPNNKKRNKRSLLKKRPEERLQEEDQMISPTVIILPLVSRGREGRAVFSKGSS